MLADANLISCDEYSSRNPFEFVFTSPAFYFFENTSLLLIRQVKIKNEE